MYAIVDIAGEQIKLEKNQKVVTARLDGDVGSKVEFEKVLFISNDDDVKVGTPYVEGAKVQATILEHEKSDKTIVFKKKRRKTYRVLNGHRQPLTRIQIDGISA